MKKNTEDFVHLHVHSDASQLDGCGKIADYVRRAKVMGHRAIALTEHGTMRQYFTQLEECQECGIKPIYGIEFYVARDMRRKGLTEEEKSEITSGLKAGDRKVAIREYEEREGIRDRWHLTVLAKNEIGLKNLFKLSTNGWLEGFYYKPRIDLEELLKYKEGLIVASGCQSSVIMDYVCVGKKKKATKVSERLYSEFGENFWLEIMPHAGIDQIAANKFALELYEKWNGKVGLLATQDAHYVDVTDSEAHEALLCIGTGDSMRNPDRFRFGDGELYLKSRKQMYDSFVKNHSYMSKSSIIDSLNNTVEVCRIVEDNIINIDRFACLMPPVDVPSKFGGDEFAYTKALCIHGWTWREIPKRAEAYAKRQGITREEAIRIYKARLKHELGAVKRQRFITYFLLVRDIYNWARKQDIMCGPGRGSAAGSLIAFLLGITSVDPVEHALLFERFINPARVDMPDIDMDFEDVRRQEIIQYLRDKYGEDRVSQIATIGKLSGKQCIKDVSRVLEIPYSDVNAITNSIIERSSGDERASQTIEDSFKDFRVCREFNKKYPEVLKYAKKLEGMSKNLGIHAAGVVTSPVPLVEITPLEVRKHTDGDVVVTAVDMNGVGAHGLLKLDVLGLRTLAVLKDTVRAIKERHGVDIDLERLELNDPKVLQAFTDHDYTGIFQYDSPSADKICMGVTFDSFEDVAAMTALNRPGTARSGLATEYVERKKHPEKRKTGHFHPKVSEITSDTMGVIVYQEHVQKIFVEIAGFPPGTADSLRKKIAKKYGDETIGKERENFIRGAKEHSGIDEKTAGKIMDAITFFGSYGFNKTLSHGAYLLRAGSNKETGTPWLQVGKLYEMANSRTEGTLHPHVGYVTGGRMTAIAQKIKYGKYNLISMYGDFRCRPNKFKGIYDNGIQDTYEVVLDDGEKTCGFSKSHRLLTREGYKAVGRLEKGDELVFMSSEYDHSGYGTNFDSTFSQKDRYGKFWEQIVDDVWERANDCCEICGIVGERGRGKHEVAHIKTPSECDYNPKVFHCLGNLQLLCNSCHKKMDYEKGERTKRWRKGRNTYLKKVERVDYIGKQQCYDIEMDSLGHNYVAARTPDSPGVISHNSHATSYGVIAYWGMWLKVYYTLEFYWALLKNTSDRIRIQGFAKDAKRHGVELLPPGVSVSKREFAIDPNRIAIRGSLVDIKGVGEGASENIMRNQPYVDLADFLDRVERRKVHKGVVTALAKSGALNELVPNVKWFIENIETLWKKYFKNKTSRIEALGDIEESKKLSDYAEEERQLIASQVNPLAFGRHPIDAYGDFIEKNIRVKTVMMSDEDFWSDNDDKGIFICGVIIEVKYNQIGDFHTGELPSEDVRNKMFWGSRYANVNVEDAGGTQNRVKFDIDIFDDMRELIDSGIGTPIILHAVPNKKYENLRAHFAIDIEKLRRKIDSGSELDVWENIVCGKHPAKIRKWKATKSMDEELVRKQRMRNRLFFKGMTRKFTGVVMQCRLKYDKNDRLMAFFSILDSAFHSIDCICFASNWNVNVGKVIKAGNLLSIELDRQRDIRNKIKWQYFFNGGDIHLYNKSTR